MYVSRYKVTREYGGPEEGGWWYDWYEYERVVIDGLGEEAARARAVELNTQERQAKRDAREPDRFSMAGGADVEYRAEWTAREYEEEDRPYYC